MNRDFLKAASITSEMLERRDRVKLLYGERYEEKVSEVPRNRKRAVSP